MSAKHTGVTDQTPRSDPPMPLQSDLQCTLLPGDNLVMEKNSATGTSGNPQRSEVFVPGAIVIATLSNPREKFWGMILALAPEG
jgi:hypothetical protein